MLCMRTIWCHAFFEDWWILLDFFCCFIFIYFHAMNCVFTERYNFIPHKIDVEKVIFFLCCFQLPTKKGFANIMHNEKNSKEELTTLSLGLCVCTSFFLSLLQCRKHATRDFQKNGFPALGQNLDFSFYHSSF